MTVKSPVRVKVMNCWWHQVSPTALSSPNVCGVEVGVGGSWLCCRDAGFPGRRARKTVGTEGVGETDRASLKGWPA